VIDEVNQEILYTLRIKGGRIRPKVFKDGTYTVKMFNTETGEESVHTGLRPHSR
jgi:hypothetical protein